MTRHAPSPRLLSRSVAADYCGISPSTFDDWVRRRILPGPIPGTRRWDVRSIDAALDKASGLIQPADGDTAFDRWIAEQGHARAS